MRIHTLGCSALLLSGCGTAPVTPTPAVDVPTRLERRLIAALTDADIELRLEAIRFLGYFGTDAHVVALGAAAADLDPRVRLAAYTALGTVAFSERAARPAATRLLLAGTGDGVRRCREAAILNCRSGEAEDWTALEVCLADASLGTRLLAAFSLHSLGVPMHPEDLADLVCSGGKTNFTTVLLADLDDPSQRPLLTSFARSEDPWVRQRAAEADARLDAIARGAPRDWLPPAAVRRSRFRVWNAAARNRVRELEWHAVDRGEVLAAARRARVVFFGEMHFSDGPLREAQCELLRAFAGDHPERVVLGYEPSVEDAQRSVIDLAQQLGIAVRSLEPGWRDLHPRKLYAERDDEAVAEIRACLAEHPDRRMFVIRGEGHTLPQGYLCRQLGFEPMIVLSTALPRLRVLGDRPDLIGRTWRLGGGDRLFYWGVSNPMPMSARLTALLTASTSRRRP